jgi:3-deoxy-D-manno-octulosonic-acid transferase
VSLLWGAYRAIAPCLGAVAPAAAWLASPHERPLWRERMGEVALAGGCDAWVHAASLGEAAVVPPFLRELERVRPGGRYYLTATSRTGRARLAESGRPTSLAPIDSPQATRRFLDGIRPARVFLVETELWPHWLLRARALRIPVAVVSARLSERSVRRYVGLGAGLRGLVVGLAAVLCQGEADQARWLAIGADPARTRVVGNLKSDGLPRPAADRGAERGSLGLDPARPLLVLGSLRPGEARLLARAWRAQDENLRRTWQVVAVPRHPRASSDLRAEAVASGVEVVTIEPGGEAPAGAWRWDDRTGVLAGWYRAAELAFVGGSLTPFGGHNPLEPAACGVAVITGPHHASQRDAVRALAARGALAVAEGGAPLASTLARWLADGGARAAAGAAALEVASEMRGAAARAVDALVELGLWAS